MDRFFNTMKKRNLNKSPDPKKSRGLRSKNQEDSARLSVDNNGQNESFSRTEDNAGMMGLERDNTADSLFYDPVDGIAQVQERLERLRECMYNTSPTRYSAMDSNTVTTNIARKGTPGKHTTKGGGTGIFPLTTQNVGKHNRNQDLIMKKSQSAPDLGNI